MSHLFYIQNTNWYHKVLQIIFILFRPLFILVKGAVLKIYFYKRDLAKKKINSSIISAINLNNINSLSPSELQVNIDKQTCSHLWIITMTLSAAECGFVSSKCGFIWPEMGQYFCYESVSFKSEASRVCYLYCFVESGEQGNSICGGISCNMIKKIQTATQWFM